MEAARKEKKLCPHQRQKNYCRECGGSAFCEHQRRRSHCKDCDGSAICEHQRIRSTCKDCGGGSICEHQRIRSRCKECSKQPDQASAHSDLPRAAGGKRGAREAGLGEAGAAKQPRPT